MANFKDRVAKLQQMTMSSKSYRFNFQPSSIAEELRRTEDDSTVTATAEERVNHLRTEGGEWWSLLLKLQETLPRGVRWLTQQVFEYVSENFPNIRDRDNDKLCFFAAKFFFDNYVRIPLLVPHVFGMLPSRGPRSFKNSPETTKNLRLIVQLLHNVATSSFYLRDQRSKRESKWLSSINNLIRQHKSDALSWIRKILDLKWDMEDALLTGAYEEHLKEKRLHTVRLNQVYHLRWMLASESGIVSGKKDPLYALTKGEGGILSTGMEEDMAEVWRAGGASLVGRGEWERCARPRC